jgi:hypothetical protein
MLVIEFSLIFCSRKLERQAFVYYLDYGRLSHLPDDEYGWNLMVTFNVFTMYYFLYQKSEGGSVKTHLSGYRIY